ncbi:MAG TPA: hypothetical protein VJ733_08335 [Candidatus Binatia bacterium]|nr:hypothetical protein [Candidatus Binatia bacterium]
MALRLYTKEEFENELRQQLGLTPTGEITDVTQAWKTRCGRVVLVPLKGIDVPELGERFPDSWMARIYLEVERVNSI